MGTLGRYLMIARYASYKDQKKVFHKLYKMYPAGTKFVVLPMDMTYLGAGSPKRKYLAQLEEIYDCKDPSYNGNVPYENLLPFVHVDPRRIERDNQPKGGEPFFLWKPKKGGGVELEHCILKRYLEGKYHENGKDKVEKPRFCGIKIYPAQGYYPFDKHLLPLWLYCAEKGIPITTHCTVGTVYYRGLFKKEWLKHPVFTQKGKFKPLPVDTHHALQINFTHPLNYLVLLEDEYLKRWLYKIIGVDFTQRDTDKLSQNEIKEIKQRLTEREQQLLEAFNFWEDSIQSLSRLKINLAHYGGSEEWEKYLENETEESNQEITENPWEGISLLHSNRALKEAKSLSQLALYEKPAWIWHPKVDWYSIISSMMLQYKGVYADISYILHSEKVYPLLQQTLNNSFLKKKVLFGTDFYVVRNHKSEKALYNEITAGLEEKHIEQIARINPKLFLSHQAPK